MKQLILAVVWIVVFSAVYFGGRALWDHFKKK